MRSLLLAAASLFACACDGEPLAWRESSAERRWRERGEGEWPEFDAQRARIEAEVARGELPSWAGSFAGSNHSSCGLGSWNVTIELAPAARIVWTRVSGFGDRRNRGTVMGFDDGWVNVRWDFACTGALRRMDPYRSEPELSDRVWLSSWGDRDFLVPECDLAHFVNVVNRSPDGLVTEPPFAFRWKPGAAPDASLPYYELNRLKEARPAGRPTLPAPWDARIRSEPLMARILEAGRPMLEHRDHQVDMAFLSQHVRLDRGTADGVFVGMNLHLARRAEPGVVVACDERRAELVFRWERRDERVAAWTLPLAPGMELTSDFRR